MILEYCHECRTVRLTNEYDIQKHELPYPPCAVCKGEHFERVDEVYP